MDNQWCRGAPRHHINTKVQTRKKQFCSQKSRKYFRLFLFLILFLPPKKNYNDGKALDG